MIIGLGIDSIEINRFMQWSHFSSNILRRFFSKEEIDYILHTNNPQKNAERLAVRFAAREAFYKALCHIAPTSTISFFIIAQKITIKKNANKSPVLVIDWDYINDKTNLLFSPENISIHLSISHNKTIATALVILETRV
jgi:holo-[acyl-carrier protein] synthase